jgi:methionyl-tRNA formyltransferase
LTDKARTIFIGTGGFAVPIVAALKEHPSIELLAVVTAPRRDGAKAKLLEPPVATWASDNEVPTLRPHRLRTSGAVEQIRGHEPDLVVLADYGQIVPNELLESPRHGALNVHPSLLPRYRGATPIAAAILAGDGATGVTLMQMDTGLDTGPIVAQWSQELKGTETAPQLEGQLADLGARLLSATLDHWLAGEIDPQPQPDVHENLTRPLRRSNGRVDPTKTAAELERQVRAYQPWPGSFIESGTDRIVIWRAHPEEDSGQRREVGALVRTPQGDLGLGTADRLLILDEVQPAGGRRMTGAELLRGRPGLVVQEWK